MHALLCVLRVESMVFRPTGVVRQSTGVFVVIFAGLLQDPTVRHGVRIILAALAVEITAMLVVTKFCVALECREIGFL